MLEYVQLAVNYLFRVQVRIERGRWSREEAHGRRYRAPTACTDDVSRHVSATHTEQYSRRSRGYGGDGDGRGGDTRQRRRVGRLTPTELSLRIVSWFSTTDGEFALLFRVFSPCGADCVTDTSVVIR